VIIVDTNVVSELTRDRPDGRVISWFDAQPHTTLYLTSITAAELLFGIQGLPDGRRKAVLGSAVGRLLETGFAGRILPFDFAASISYSGLAATRSRMGRPIQIADCMIAAIALSAGDGVVATRNTTDFERIGLDLINPWDGQ